MLPAPACCSYGINGEYERGWLTSLALSFDCPLLGKTDEEQPATPAPIWRGFPGSYGLALTLARSNTYSKLVAAPRLEASHLSNAAWLSTTNMPEAIAEWELPHSWAQLI